MDSPLTPDTSDSEDNVSAHRAECYLDPIERAAGVHTGMNSYTPRMDYIRSTLHKILDFHTRNLVRSWQYATLDNRMWHPGSAYYTAQHRTHTTLESTPAKPWRQLNLTSDWLKPAEPTSCRGPQSNFTPNAASISLVHTTWLESMFISQYMQHPAAMAPVPLISTWPSDVQIDIIGCSIGGIIDNAICNVMSRARAL